MRPLDEIEAILDVSGVLLERSRDHRRIEVITLHARRDEQLPVAVVKAIDRALDQTARRRRDLLFDRRDRLRGAPVAVRVGQDTAIAKLTDQIHHEERAAFRPSMDQHTQLGRESMAGDLATPVRVHILALEKRKGDLPAQPSPLKFELHRGKWMTRQEQVGRPVTLRGSADGSNRSASPGSSGDPPSRRLSNAGHRRKTRWCRGE